MRRSLATPECAKESDGYRLFALILENLLTARTPEIIWKSCTLRSCQGTKKAPFGASVTAIRFSKPPAFVRAAYLKRLSEICNFRE